ncbi:MAG TPA: serine hydrolase domain-containing protein [Solirubrobacteraceae bacterium]|nr:serine hydrolase domain-containing protein [Solirubrobacteraceae bacterium]
MLSAIIGRVRAEALLGVIRPFVDAGVVPGAIVGVRHRGETTVEALGTTTPGGDVPLRMEAQVRISSNTKPIIAALALRLIEDGVLGLDDSVERFLPDLAERRVLRRLDGPLDETAPAQRPIIVEDLLTMRLGFGWVFESECPAVERARELGLGFGPPDPPALPPPEEWIARFATLPLLEEPGGVWRYELAFAVLGVLAARAAGVPLDVLLTDHLLTPLGMAETAFVADRAHLVPAFARHENDLVPFDGVADTRWASRPGFLDGRGGLVSTARDLLRFAGMLLDQGGGVLTPASVVAMTTDQLTPEQRAGPSASTFLDSGGWGYGVGVTRSPAGRRYGWGGGLGTLWYSWPDHDLAAVLITQVLPPSAPMFNAFTGALEGGLQGGGSAAGRAPAAGRGSASCE